MTMLYSTTLKNCLQKEVYKITLNSKKRRETLLYEAADN